jgi:PilZ domain
MHEHGSKKLDRGVMKAGAPTTKSSERREADRHVFTASAEVREIGSGAKFTTRTTDLGPGGCFVDTMVPFPIGSRVQVSVRKDQHAFEATGSVVYAQSGLGMGIAFDALDEQQRDALDAWLGELGWKASGAEQIGTAPAGVAPMMAQPAAGRMVNQHAAMVRLVRLMIGKGLLTESEGASILYDPVL